MRKEEREELEKRIYSRPEHSYTYKAGRGEPTKYVFQEKICIGIAEAMLYVSSLEQKDRDNEG